MKKTVIILKTPPGARLANQLWNFISIYAYCLEKGYQCKNWSFFEDKKQKHENNRHSRCNYYKFFNINTDILTKIIITAHLGMAKICKKARLHDRFISLIKKMRSSRIICADKGKVFYLPPTENHDAQQLAQLAGINKFSKMYFDGWLFRNPVGIEKYHQEIKKYFQPKKESINTVENFLSPLKQEYENIVGVHIRQTDYSYFSDGKFFLKQEEIKKFLEDYLKFSKKDCDKTVFLVCSDGNIDEAAFQGLNIKKGPGKTMEDLYLLSQTSVIIGSNSTFGAFAAYYGDIPFIVMQNNMDWDYYRGKDHFFSNKYSTLVNY